MLKYFSIALLFSVLLSPVSQANNCADALIPRIANPLEKLKSYFTQGLSLDETIELMKKEDARYYTFQLEGLMRLYRGVFGDQAEALRVDFKMLEDHLGAYLEKEEYLEMATKVRVPTKVMNVLTSQMKKSREDLRVFLLSTGWYSPVGQVPVKFFQIETIMKQFKWKKEKKDTKAILKQMIAELKEVETYEMDVNQLQDGLTKDRPGVHKQRRNWRWFLIYMQALDGMILLEPSKAPFALNEYGYLTSHPIAQGRFSVLKKNDYLEKPALFPQYLYLALSKVIDDLGDVKESGELLEVLTAAYVESFSESGIVKNEEDAREMVLSRLQEREDYLDFKEGAQGIKNEMERTKLITEFRKALQQALDRLE